MAIRRASTVTDYPPSNHGFSLQANPEPLVHGIQLGERGAREFRKSLTAVAHDEKISYHSATVDSWSIRSIVKPHPVNIL